MRYTGNKHHQKQANMRSRIFLIGSCIAVLVLLLGLFVPAAEPKPCPSSYTQQQINAAGCDNGPFIGERLPIVLFLFLGIQGLTILVALIYKNK